MSSHARRFEVVQNVPGKKREDKRASFRNAPPDPKTVSTGEAAAEAAGKEVPGCSESFENQSNRQQQNDRPRRKFIRMLRCTIIIIVVAAACEIFLATQLMPVFRIYGDSMAPTLYYGDIAVSVKPHSIDTGDVVAYSYQNQVLVARVIAGPGQVIDIDRDGVVSVDGKEVEEPYVTTLSRGECSIELPYQVPESEYFVMGDQRARALDSRTEEIGSIKKDAMIGRLILCIWPLNHFGGL